MINITHETKNFILWDNKNRKKIEVEARKVGKEWKAFCPFHSDKKTPNLSIDPAKNGGVYYCFACGAKGQLFDPKFINKGKTIKKIYSYKDRKGKEIFQVVRYDPKEFKQRRPDPDKPGEFIWNLKGIKRVIYNLPEITEKKDKVIFICEGEKDCDNLAKIEILATTNSGGAGKWKAEYNKDFKDREIVIPPHKDETGENHLQVIGKNLMETAKRIQVLRLPGLSKGEDISDWIERGGTLEEIFKLLKNAPEFIPQKEEEKEISLGTGEEYFRATDLRNSKKFSEKYRGQLLHCQQWNNWLVYQEGKWQVEKRNNVQGLAKGIIRDYYRQASEIIDDKERLNLIKEARKCESQRAIKAMVELSFSSMPAVPEDFDRDLYILNLKDETLNLKTMEFREHKAEDMLMKITEVSHEPEAECPEWLIFLDKIFEGNKDLINYLQTALGYSLTGDIGEQCWFILYGIGANGKTTFINVVKNILGDYGINTPFDTFLSKGKFGNIPNDLARLRGARFVSAIESPGERRFNEVLLKTIVGGDLLTARFLRQEFFDFKPECKIWLATNHKPLVKEFSPGFWRKIRLIPFKVVIPEEERILNYDKILMEEKEGIFNWILEGFKKWKEEKLKTPDEVIQATAEYKSSMDVIAEFIEDCCIENNKVRATTKELYKEYSNWCNENNEKPITNKVFGRSLEERGYKSIRFGTPQERGWGGIDLKDKEQELPYGQN